MQNLPQHGHIHCRVLKPSPASSSQRVSGMSFASLLAGMTARLRAVVYAIMLIRLQRIQEFQQVAWP